MLNRHTTLCKFNACNDAAIALKEQIDGLLTWGELEPAERDRLTRAANLTNLALARINGIGAADKPVTPKHAELL